MKKTIEVLGVEIRIEPINESDYISLTDIAKGSDRNEPRYLIHNWIKNQNTLEFLTAWEKLHNPNSLFFNSVQMDTIKYNLLKNKVRLTPKKWIEETGAIGIISKTGRYNSGVWSHKDIALHFCGWLSPEFQVYLLKSFQDLMEERFKQKQVEWTVQKLTDNVNEMQALLGNFPNIKNKKTKE